MAGWGDHGGGEAAQDSLRSVGAALRDAGLDSDSSGKEEGAPSGRGQPAEQGSAADTQQQGAGGEAVREPQSAPGGNRFQALRRPGKARQKAPADGGRLAGPVSSNM